METKNKSKSREFLEWVIVLVVATIAAVVVGATIASSSHSQPPNLCNVPVPEAGYWGCVELLNNVVIRDQNNVEYTVRIERNSKESAKITYEEKGVQFSFVVPDGTDVSYTLHIGHLFVQRHINKFYVRHSSWDRSTQ